jgi:hypothetical protein
MIYKFNKEEKDVEIFSFDSQLRICIQDSSLDGLVFIDLNKEDLFKLIGALHCIQKEIV